MVPKRGFAPWVVGVIATLVGSDTLARNQGHLDAAAIIAAVFVGVIAFWVTVVVMKLFRR